MSRGPFWVTIGWEGETSSQVKINDSTEERKSLCLSLFMCYMYRHDWRMDWSYLQLIKWATRHALRIGRKASISWSASEKEATEVVRRRESLTKFTKGLILAGWVESVFAARRCLLTPCTADGWSSACADQVQRSSTWINSQILSTSAVTPVNGTLTKGELNKVRVRDNEMENKINENQCNE